MLYTADTQLQFCVLEAIKSLLESAGEVAGLIQEMEELRGTERLETLQGHNNVSIRKKATEILERFLRDEHLNEGPK